MRKRSSGVVNTYLQLIHLNCEAGKRVTAKDLVRWVDSAPSTVHATLGRMKRDGFVDIDTKKRIELTDKGSDQAERLKCRRLLVERFLHEKLGLSRTDLNQHVFKMIEGLTPLIELKLAMYLGPPDPRSGEMNTPAIQTGNR